MSDYATLQADVVGTVKDSQVDLAQARDFIRLAEYKLQRDLVAGASIPRHMLARLETTTDSASAITLPSDHHETRSVSVASYFARYSDPAQVESNAEGFADAKVVLDYYQRLPALTDINTANWLLDVGYDTYLWAACLQYVPWGQESEVLQLWSSFYSDALGTVKSTYAPQPRGSLRAGKGPKYNAHYTIIGNQMLFGR